MRYWRQKCRGAAKPAVRANAAGHLNSLVLLRCSEPRLTTTHADSGVTLTFLGLTRSMALPADWRCESIESVPHLWRFHLHDQQWLRDLSPEERWRWVRDWIEANRLTDRRELSDAWHPFCVSRRVVAWIRLWIESPPTEHQDQILTSLARQVMFLSRQMEWDLRGNHLLFNLWALGIAAAFFDGAVGDRALAVVRRHLPSQLKEQILPSGEHFERSPMYHAEMLEIVADLQTALRSAPRELMYYTVDSCNRMLAFHQALLHPDNRIPLLGDSAFDQVSFETFMRTTRQPISDDSPRHESQQIGNYWLMRIPRSSKYSSDPFAPSNCSDFLLFDTGPVGADELPAHAHCDLLGLEASIGGKRFLVDSGVFDYEDSEMRMYCRSTFAHNVLQIDDVDQCDVWSRFRMGYRGWPTSMTMNATGDGFHWCRATHNAYRRIGVKEVGRLVACRDDGIWVIADWAGGARGKHRLVSRLHLHPDVVMEQSDDHSARVRIGERILIVSGHGLGKLVIERGWYCPRFGERHENSVLSWKTDDILLPATIGWLIQPADIPAATLELTAGPTPIATVKRGADRFVI